MHRLCLTAAALAALLTALPTAHAEQPTLNFEIKQLAQDLNEGCDIADVNRDGKPDVIAGRYWYAAPDFIPRPLRLLEDWNGYTASNGDFAHDVNGDGWVDVITMGFMETEIRWYENPGGEKLARGHLWPEHVLVDTKTNRNECEIFRQLIAGGAPELIVDSWNKKADFMAWRLASKKTKEGTRHTAEKILMGKGNNGHGIALGDLNGDGREDVALGTGWYERPEGFPSKDAGLWKWHPWGKDLHSSCPMIIRDLDGDGRNDLIWGKGHDYGLYWWRQLDPSANGKLRWEKHTIDESWSQPHCLHWADLDGDGEGELITGKRVYAHNGKDPGGKEQPCLYYYEWDPDSMEFTRHTIDEGRVGTGMQIRTADLNNDGRLDIAVAGKSGTYILFNKGRGNTN